MESQEAKELLNSVQDMTVVQVDEDADTTIFQVKDTDRGPRNFHPSQLALVLQQDFVFDAWVEDNNLYIQTN